jgi:hypothetical protein
MTAQSHSPEDTAVSVPLQKAAARAVRSNHVFAIFRWRRTSCSVSDTS